jgi:hypothetical protein
MPRSCLGRSLSGKRNAIPPRTPLIVDTKSGAKCTMCSGTFQLLSVRIFIRVLVYAKSRTMEIFESLRIVCAPQVCHVPSLTGNIEGFVLLFISTASSGGGYFNV